MLSGKIHEEYERLKRWKPYYIVSPNFEIKKLLKQESLLSPGFIKHIFKNPFDKDANDKDIKTVRKLVEALYDENNEPRYKFKFRFLGIYDTVSSYANGYDVLRFLNATQFDNDAEQLYLHELDKVDKVVHFTAIDEHRYNFSLTRIKNATNKNKKDKRIEKDFPGVHSDVGGNYISETEDVYLGRYSLLDLKTGGSSLDLSTFYKELIFEKWYKAKELRFLMKEDFINIETKTIGLKLEAYFLPADFRQLHGRRFVFNEYSYIPLHFMYDYFISYLKDKNVDLSTLLTVLNQEDFEKKYSIQDDYHLKKAKDRLENYAMNNTSTKWGNKWEFNKVFFQKEANIKAKKVAEELFKDIINSEDDLVLDQKRNKIIITNLDKIKRTKYTTSISKEHDVMDLICFDLPRTFDWIDFTPKEKEMYNLTLSAEDAEINLYQDDPEDKDMQGLLGYLRHNYFHWSAHWSGSPVKAMVPREKRIRKEFK